MKTRKYKKIASAIEQPFMGHLTVEKVDWPVASYFPVVPESVRAPCGSCYQTFVFDKLPSTVELLKGGEQLPRQRFQEMFKHEVSLERRRWKTESCLNHPDQQKDIRLRRRAMREILHGFENFPTARQTRFLAVEYLEEFLQQAQIETTEISFNAAATSCFRLACKIEESIVLDDDAFDFGVQTLADWEISLLKSLGWKTRLPTIASFLSFCYHSTNLCNSQILGKKIQKTARKLAECCVLDERMTMFKPSIKAVCCFMLALKNNNVKDWYQAIDLLDFAKENNVTTEFRTCLSFIALYWISPTNHDIFLTQSELNLDLTNGLTLNS